MLWFVAVQIWARLGQRRGYLSYLGHLNVWALHQELHVAANPNAVSSDRSGSDPQYAAKLQRLPRRTLGYCVAHEGNRELVLAFLNIRDRLVSDVRAVP